MARFAPALACLALLAAIAAAGPNADKTKKAAAKAKCPGASAQCADCPGAKARCGACPDAAARCPGMAKAARANRDIVTIKCEGGAKQVSVAKLTAQKKYADYKGKRYYFGCSGCLAEFKKSPAKYASTHTGFAIPKAARKTATK